MALFAIHKEAQFGVGDRVRVSQEILEKDKARTQSFEGTVISIKGRQENKSFTLRRIGEHKIGIERIFPLASPTIEKIEVLKYGTPGVRSAKLYYVRRKSPKEIAKIYSRAARKNQKPKAKINPKKKKSGKAR